MEHDKTFTVSMSTVQSNMGPSYVEVRVTEQDSGVTLCEFTMPREQAWQLLTGSYITVETGWTPPPEELAKVGKKMEHKGVGLGYPKGIWENDKSKEWALEQARSRPEAKEYTNIHVHKTNSGWAATYRRWV